MDVDNNDKCPICLSEWKIGDEVGKLACGHEFELDCLSKWLNEKRNCPLCREAFKISDNHHVEEEDEDEVDEYTDEEHS